MLTRYDHQCCEECTTCNHYWKNTEVENDCVGNSKPCYIYKENEEKGHP